MLLVVASPRVGEARSNEGHHWAQVLRATADAASTVDGRIDELTADREAAETLFGETIANLLAW